MIDPVLLAALLCSVGLLMLVIVTALVLAAIGLLGRRPERAG